MMRSLFLLALIITLLLPATSWAAVVHVPADQPTIQAGIDAAVDGDIVLVADGTYTGDGNRDIRFGGKAITLRSENGPENCVIDASPEHVRVFVFEDGEENDSVLEGFTITGGHGDIDEYDFGGGIYCDDSSPTIRGNTVTGNTACYGAGICCIGLCKPIIEGNLITANQMGSCGNGSLGGGIFLFECGHVVIRDNVISWNRAGLLGKGTAIYTWGSSHIDMINNLVAHNGVVPNESHEALGLKSGVTYIRNLTLVDNDVYHNGAITVDDGYITIEDSIIRNDFHTQIKILYEPTVFRVSYSNVKDGWEGEENIDADPLFVSGPQNNYYLSHRAAGQPVDSPCVDAGDPENEIFGGTTRIDLKQDIGAIDMGYHTPLEIPARLVLGPGPAYDNPPLVRIFPPHREAEFEYEFNAYGSQHYGVNVTTGEVTGDGTDDILTGAGPGEALGPHVRGFGVDGTPLAGLSFFAYGTGNRGVNVATGDLDGDGFDEIITGPGPAEVFGPHVRGWNYDNSGMVTAMSDVSYFAYGTPRWGVHVSAGDIDGDGYDEIVTGAGPGPIYGPHVRGWDYDNTAITPITAVSFMAYGTHQMGVRVSCGDVDGDGIEEIVTAPGPGATFGPHIRGWDYDGSTVTPLPGLSFFMFDTPILKYGATVFAGADLNSDGRNDLVVGSGPDPEAGALVKVFRYDGAQVDEWFFLPGYSATHGTNVAAGRF